MEISSWITRYHQTLIVHCPKKLFVEYLFYSMNNASQKNMAYQATEKVEEQTTEHVDLGQAATTPTAGRPLRKVDSQDSLHRNNFFTDTEHLQGITYWRSTRFIGSPSGRFPACQQSLHCTRNASKSSDRDRCGHWTLSKHISQVFTIFVGILHLVFGRLSDTLGDEIPCSRNTL